MSMKYSRIISHTIMLLAAICTAQCLHAATIVESIMDAMRSKFAAAKTVEILFTLSNNGQTEQGSALVSGASFFLETPSINVWYDGRTQWALIKSLEEVNITEPTADELASTNPFAILNDYASYFKARKIDASAGSRRVQLTPKDKNSLIAEIAITVSVATNFPQSVVLLMDDGRKMSIKVDAIKSITAKPEATYRYDSKKFPAKEIIDLR